MSQTKIKVVDQTVNDLPIPNILKKYVGTYKGEPARAEMVSVDIPMHIAQRDLHTKDIIKWVTKSRGFDWSLFGVVTVVEDSKGNQTCLDAQHRLQMIRWILPNVTQVPAHIIYTDDTAYASMVFAGKNGTMTRRLGAEELFWAQTIEGDKHALYLKDILESAEISCGKVNEAPDRKTVKYASFDRSVKMGADETVYAIELWQQAYPKSNIQAQVMCGLTRLFTLKKYEDQGNPDTELGKLFYEWFTENVPCNYKPVNLNFAEYHNTNVWHNGVAYGLQKKFNIWLDHKGHKRVPIKQIQDIYQSGITGKDAEDTDE